MDLVLGNGRHLWVPASNQLGVLFDLVLQYLVEYNGVDVFAAS